MAIRASPAGHAGPGKVDHERFNTLRLTEASREVLRESGADLRRQVARPVSSAASAGLHGSPRSTAVC